MNSNSIFRLIADRVPASAHAYCLVLWQTRTFELRVKKRRTTKAGDFTFKKGDKPIITVNEDLNPYLFLIVYIHEVAHLDVHRTFGNRVRAHGTEWKNTFQKLMQPVMHRGVFPRPVLVSLKKHMADPMASAFSDSALMLALRKYDTQPKHIILLSKLSEKTIFRFQGKWFEKGRLKRTRVECKELTSGACYLVPEDALVGSAQLRFF